MSRAPKSLCVFCGSSLGNDPIYRETAARVGTELAGRGIRLVYGGGHVGLMGGLADAALAQGGEVIGVIPGFLEQREVAHRGLSSLRIVTTMHERKALMNDLSDGFLALPGGFGTFEEFCEALTWSQLGLHPKPVGLLNVAGYFDHLLALFDHALECGFLAPESRALVNSSNDLRSLLSAMFES